MLVGVAATLFYALTSAGWIAHVDVIQSQAVAQAIADHHRLWFTSFPTSPIHLIWPGDAVRGVGGHLYGKHAVGYILLMVPITEAQHLNLVGWRVADFCIGMINPAAIGATVAIVYRMMVALSKDRRISLVGASIVAVSTLLWPYAHVPYDAGPTTLGVTVALAALFSLRSGIRWQLTLLAGLGLGLAVLVRNDSLLFVAIDAVWLAVILWRRTIRTIVIQSLAFFAPIAGALAVTAWYNLARFGSVTQSGYIHDASLQRQNPVSLNLLGLLISPGKGVLIFCPVLLVAALGLPWLFRRSFELGLVIVVTVLLALVAYASLRNWSLAFSWGPRYLIPFIPMAMLPLIGLLMTWRERSLLVRVGSSLLIVLSSLIQALGVASPWIAVDILHLNFLHPLVNTAWTRGQIWWNADWVARQLSQGHLRWIDIFWISKSSPISLHGTAVFLLAIAMVIGLAFTVRALLRAAPRPEAS